MRIASLVLSSIIVFVIFTKCKKDPTTTPTPPIVYDCNNLTRRIDSAKKWIIGKWDWVEEKRIGRAIGVKYFTPATEGYNFGYNYSHDTVFNTYNGIVTDTSKFIFGLLRDYTLAPEDSIPVIVHFDIKTGTRINMTPYKICKDTLVFQYQYVNSVAGEFKFRKIP